jgi:hypothetical protein
VDVVKPTKGKTLYFMTMKKIKPCVSTRRQFPKEN